jgi:hypothetical protein
MLKKYKGIIAGLIFFIMSFSAFYIFILNQSQETEDWEEIIIFNGENSVYTGYTQSELADKLAEVMEVTPIVSKETETHHSETWYKYYYQKDTSIIIALDGNLFTETDNYLIRMESVNEPTTIFLNDSSEAVEIVFKIWERFLGTLNIQLEENDYNISVKSRSTRGWRVFLRQTYNDNFPLMNTGIVAEIEREYKGISSLNIFEWSNKKIEKPILISIEEAKDIICNEIPDISINRSMLNLSGYKYISENVYYNFNYEIPVDNGSDTIMIVFSDSKNENGAEINDKNEQWVGYNFYVNVETNELTFSKYGISYLKK